MMHQIFRRFVTSGQNRVSSPQIETVNKLCASRRIAEALSLILNTPFETPFTHIHAYQRVIKACRNSNSSISKHRVASLLKDTEQQLRSQLTLTQLLYHSLMDSYGAIGDFTKVMALGKEMEQVGIPWNGRTYTTLIRACCRDSKVDQALFYLGEMEVKGFPPTIFSYNPIMHAMGKQKDVERAFSLFRTLIRKKIQPDGVTFNTLIQACAISKQSSKAVETFEQMPRFDVTPDARTFNTLIQAVAIDAQNLNRAYEILHAMRDQSVKPDAVTVNTLMNLSIRHGALSRAEKLFKTLDDYHVKPDLRTFNILIDGCSKNKQLNKAFEYYGQMVKTHVPDGFTFSSLISACGNAGKLNRALEVYEEMKLRHISPDFITLAALINACAPTGNIEKADSIWKDMIAQLGQPRSVAIFNAYLKVASHAKEMTKAMDMYKEMQAQGISPTEVTFNSLIHCCSETNHLEQGIELLKETIHRAMHLTPAPMTSLLSACTRLKRLDVAIAIWKCMETKEIPHHVLPPTLASISFDLPSLAIQPNAWTYNALMQCAYQCKGYALVQWLMETLPPLTPDMVTHETYLKAMIELDTISPKEIIDTYRTLESMQPSSCALFSDLQTLQRLHDICETLQDNATRILILKRIQAVNKA